ncbi:MULTISPECIES: hypothetical protein [unclassified Luteococcus]|uniref:hypothetical protein n=1 Tax=unclassified Luteococcus TaxID=2639923 RepID=UPI00313AF165
MRKNTLTSTALTALLPLTLGLSACGGSDSATPANSPSTSAAGSSQPSGNASSESSASPADSSASPAEAGASESSSATATDGASSATASDSASAAGQASSSTAGTTGTTGTTISGKSLSLTLPAGFKKVTTNDPDFEVSVVKGASRVLVSSTAKESKQQLKAALDTECSSRTKNATLVNKKPVSFDGAQADGCVWEETTGTAKGRNAMYIMEHGSKRYMVAVASGAPSAAGQKVIDDVVGGLHWK